MSDDSAAATATPKPKKDEVIEDAVVVDETETPVVVDETTAAEPEPETVTTEPAEPQHRVVYVQVPPVPRKLGNRGVGSLIAVLATIVFTVVYAVVGALVTAAGTGKLSFVFLGLAEFYIPSLFFLIGFVLLVLILNRANWWAYIIGSIIVGLFVYFGSIGLSLLTSGIVQNTPAEAADLFRNALTSPSLIVAGLLAREVALWTGALISRRGRRLRTRNIENREAYERELAATRAEHERAAAAAPAAG